jgi:hypothetical protein
LSFHVDGEVVVERRLAHCFDRLHRPYPGVEEQDIQSAETRSDLVGDGLCVRNRTGVRSQNDDVFRERFSRGGDPLGIVTGRDDRMALLVEDACSREANARGPSRDEGDRPR